ncbi:hypothetical protein BUALT_Bualt07G0095100 [Buddleja alternifolia]|uniref:Extra-large guanine nucleotide-binding protein 3 n=1 Tax=Buddleja alternifolia TaxID=168488 RepID=A0AAV6XHK2_9LAMI|nr:hypothetical protein BUALT_Bualt07G0095100 [Buddleja alternifolia]
MAEPNSWEELLRKMLPDGAPLPDEDQLDYSISIDYIGPSPFFNPPINPIIPKTKFTTFHKQPPSLTPINPALFKSRSNSDTTNSDDDKRFSASCSIDTAHNNSNYDRDEVAYDRYVRYSDEWGREVKRGGLCALSVGNKGRECSRCGKWLLIRRLRCIVCRAEYCKKCVLKAMGSMPEGRKCVGCIGKPIDERNRGRLGKGSRFLSRVCGRLEVKRIMEVERECKANQVRPEQVIVNGKELREDELDELFASSMSTKDLKPGRYWYDKDSGLCGKEGEKPDRILSSKLDVGGKLQVDASAGNTRVYMNGREITKLELRVLKLAKVQCLRNTHFWLYEDGSYEEEGQNNIKGFIWEKASIRFLCSLFSLPVPPQSAFCTKEEPASLSFRLLPECSEQHRVQKLLLLGLEDSGTSTIFKQVKFVYTNKFTTEELQNMKLIIQSNVYRYLSVLLESREHLEEEALMNNESPALAAERSILGEMECDGSRQCIYSVNPKIKNFSDWLLDLVATGDIDTYFPAAAREYAPIIDEIWKHPAIQYTYKRIVELQYLPHVAKHFLGRVLEISSNEYEPSEKDILFAEGITHSNGLACIEFSFDDHSVVSEIYNENSQRPKPLSKYQLIQPSSKGLHSGCKWLEMFEGMRAVIFCVSLSDYDQLWTNSRGLQLNKMLASRDFFESVARHSCFDGKPFVLLLNKYDLFEDKINQVPLTVCEWFRDFKPLKSHSKSPSIAHQAYYYIAVKFKEMYTCITGRKLYVFQLQAHEQKSVDEAFRYVREIIEWEDKDVDIYAISDENSISGTGTSSSPCNH